jgi:hypothetical protein
MILFRSIIRICPMLLQRYHLQYFYRISIVGESTYYVRMYMKRKLLIPWSNKREEWDKRVGKQKDGLGSDVVRCDGNK